MPAANVPLVIDQGEDWTTEVIWTDSYENPVQVIHPCQLDIKTNQGQTIVSLVSDPDIPDGEIPGIAISTEIGLLQLHIPAEQTAGLVPGNYDYDLFVTDDNQDDYALPQMQRLIYGSASVNKRITIMPRSTP